MKTDQHSPELPIYAVE